jgi:hypothetical protein
LVGVGTEVVSKTALFGKELIDFVSSLTREASGNESNCNSLKLLVDGSSLEAVFEDINTQSQKKWFILDFKPHNTMLA